MALFVIHEHAASHLHWDLRLEMEGVLKSWALPKSPPQEAGIRRLAIQVDDHPLSYASFEGTIPEGHYGAGAVSIWDKGTYTLLDHKSRKLILHFEGVRLKGRYVLVHMKKNEWLFLMKKSESA